jgi:hypothetical protein
MGETFLTFDVQRLTFTWLCEASKLTEGKQAILQALSHCLYRRAAC